MCVLPPPAIFPRQPSIKSLNFFLFDIKQTQRARIIFKVVQVKRTRLSASKLCNDVSLKAHTTQASRALCVRKQFLRLQSHSPFYRSIIANKSWKLIAFMLDAWLSVFFCSALRYLFDENVFRVVSYLIIASKSELAPAAACAVANLNKKNFSPPTKRREAFETTTSSPNTHKKASQQTQRSHKINI